MQFWRRLASGIIGGTLAGLILGVLILLAITPLINQAEKFEKDSHSYAYDKLHHWGTLVGAVVLGLVYGLILALISLRQETVSFKKGLFIGLAGYFLIYFLPSLVFLPNPPGVEAVASVAVRQSWWFMFLSLNLFWFWVYRRLQLPLFLQHIFGFTGFLGLLSFFFAFAPRGLTPTNLPTSLLLNFRVASFLVMLVFWLLLGLLTTAVYKWLVKDEATARPLSS